MCTIFCLFIILLKRYILILLYILLFNINAHTVQQEITVYNPWDIMVINFLVFAARLNQGTNASMGGVEVFYKGEWNGICDAKFEDVDAAVICKHLGFGYGKAIPYSSFGKLTGNITIYDVGCDGTEDGLLKCKYTYGKNRCPTKTYASVYCSNQPFTQEGQCPLEIIF